MVLRDLEKYSIFDQLDNQPVHLVVEDSKWTMEKATAEVRFL
jgi:hypothetical protein